MPATPKTHVISRKMIRDFLATTSDRSAEAAMTDWYKKTRASRWDHFASVRRTFSDADWVDGWVVFNVGGNKYRIVTRIDFPAKVVYMVFVGTHKDYDKGRWKES